MADTGNGVVRCIDQRTGIMKVLAGNPASMTVPTTQARPATDVALLRPVGLTLDAVANDLFVTDLDRGQLLRVQIRPGGDLLSVVVGAADLQRPASIAYHDFASGPRLLFLLDRGGAGTGAGAVPPPSLRVVDVDTLGHTVIDPGFTIPFRLLYDLALRALPDGSVELFVIADVGETFEEITNVSARPNIDTRFGFETNLYDGLDGDSDGRFDSLDEDSREPLKVQVLRFSFPPSGVPVMQSVPIVRPPVRMLQCHKKFPVSIIHDPGCSPVPPGTASVIDLRDLIFQAIAVDSAGRVHLVSSQDGTIRYVEFDQTNQIVATGMVAGIDSDVASPADGNDPRLTRLNRPLDVLFDRLGNLFVADTVNNRVRRTWLGDIVRGN